MINNRQKMLIRLSFEALKPIADEAGALFYNRLFAVDPSLKRLFRTTPEEQGRILMHVIGMAVGSLNHVDTLVTALENLGTRHAGYGVREEHYETVGVCLLWTLEQGLGEAFTDEVREAWTVFYGMIAGSMLRGASNEAPTVEFVLAQGNSAKQARAMVQ